MIKEYVVLTVRNADHVSTFRGNVTAGLSEWLDLWIHDFLVEDYGAAMSISLPFVLIFIEVGQIKPDAYEEVINQRVYPIAWKDEDSHNFSVVHVSPWKGVL